MTLWLFLASAFAQDVRPGVFGVGMGVTSRVPLTPVASVRLRLGDGFVLEPSAMASVATTTAREELTPFTTPTFTFPTYTTTTTTTTTGLGTTPDPLPVILQTQTSSTTLAAGLLARIRAGYRGPVDLCVLVGGEFASLRNRTQVREGTLIVDTQTATAVSGAATVGVGVEMFASEHASATMDLLNPAVQITSEPGSDGDDTLAFGLAPYVRGMVHLYF